MYLGLSYLIAQEFITNELVLRYIQGHPISQVTVAMFFVGVASLLLISKNIFEQFSSEQTICIETASTSEQSESELAAEDETESEPNSLTARSQSYLRRLEELPIWIQEHYLWMRMSSALGQINRTGSTANVEDELKYQHDIDTERQQQRYSLVRILIWATPMLGFLGTVLGISEALGGINVGAGNDFQHMMDGLRGSLYVAFDTTALALTLSMVLMFAQFLVDRFAGQLLTLVDHRAHAEIAAAFDLADSSPELERLTNEIVRASEKATERQVELWKSTIKGAEQAWASSLTQSNAQVQENLSTALDENVGNLAHYLGEAISKADDAMTRRLQQWQVTLSDNARLMEEQQKRLREQAEQIERLVEEHGGSQVFEDAVRQHQEAIDSSNQLKDVLNALDQSVSSFHEASISAVDDVRNRLIESEKRAHELQRTLSEVKMLNRSERDVSMAETLLKSTSAKPADERGRQQRPFIRLETTSAANQDTTENINDPTQTSVVMKPQVASKRKPSATPELVFVSASDDAGSAKKESKEAKRDEPDPANDSTAGDPREVIIKFPGVSVQQAHQVTEREVQSAADRASNFLSRRRSA